MVLCPFYFLQSCVLQYKTNTTQKIKNITKEEHKIMTIKRNPKIRIIKKEHKMTMIKRNTKTIVIKRTKAYG
jgi:hypothetical protein